MKSHGLLIAAATAVCLIGASFARAEQAPVRMEHQTYKWRGQFVALDSTTRVATLKAQIPAYVEKYIGRFKPGERLILVWDMVGKAEADHVLALWDDDGALKSYGHTGYVLPIEFGGVDLSAHAVMFKTRVPETVLKPLTLMKSGDWIRGVSPMLQPSQDARITSIERVAPDNAAQSAP